MNFIENKGVATYSIYIAAIAVSESSPENLLVGNYFWYSCYQKIFLEDFSEFLEQLSTIKFISQLHTFQFPSSSKQRIHNEPSILNLDFGFLDFSLSESSKNELSRTFCFPKLFLERWILHCFCNVFFWHARDIIIRIWIIVY